MAPLVRNNLMTEAAEWETSGGEPAAVSRTPSAISLYLETSKDSNEFGLAPDILDWANIKRELDGGEDTASLVVRSLDASKIATAGTIGTQHLKHVLDLLHPDLRVRIAMPQGASAPIFLFQGYPMSTTPSWSERHQAVTCVCLSEGQTRLRYTPETHVTGRLMRYSTKLLPWDRYQPDLVDVQSLPAVFNPNGKPNMLAERLDFGAATAPTRVLFVFDQDDGPDTGFWNAADALRYVAYFYALRTGVDINDFLLDTDGFVGLVGEGTAGDPFARKMTARLHNVSIQSMNPEEALVAVCAAAGLHFELVLAGDSAIHTAKPKWSLRVLAVLDNESDELATLPRRMAAPRVLNINRDVPFADYTNLTPADIANRNEARQAPQLTFDRRIFNAPTFLGGAKEFQVTLLLRPGWKPDPNVDDVADRAAALRFWTDELGGGDLVNEQFREEGEAPIYRSQYHAKHPDFAQVADVLRKWVFPDDEEYMDNANFESSYVRANPPWNDLRYFIPYDDSTLSHLVYAESDLGGSVPLTEVAEWSVKRRPFLPTIQRVNVAVTSREPIVWLNFRATDPLTALADPHWHQYTGKAKFDAQRSALWFTDDNLWASAALREDAFNDFTTMIPAILGQQDDGSFGSPHFFVAITCTVRGDRRMSHRAVPRAPFTRLQAKIVDLGFERFVERTVIEPDNDALGLVSFDPDPAFRARNDGAALAAYANRAGQQMADEAISGSWEAPYVKTDLRLGDSFAGVPGLGIDFAVYPEIKALEWSKGPDEGFRTVVHLTDLRHAPEVGSE